jgi:integrase
MAAYYKRPDSPFHWVRFQKPDGTWGAKSTGIRIDSEGALRKVKQCVAEHQIRERDMDGLGGTHRFDVWVPSFLKRHCASPKTLTRYMNAWSALSTYLQHRGVISPTQVTYQLCTDYPAFRTKPPKDLMRARSHNTALTELKVLSCVMQEAVRNSLIPANPCLKLGFKRTPPKQKPEITDDEVAQIDTALASRDEWMRDCWLVAMRQGCRLSETAVPLSRIDEKTQTVSFHTKGGRTHTAPLHDDLRPLVAKAREQKRKTLVELPDYPAKKWHQFFRRIGLPHLSFHSTRVTVATKLARAGFPIYQTKASIGHASDTVHRIYQRLTPVDVRSLGAVLSNPPAENQDSPATTPKPKQSSTRRRASEIRPTSSV